MEITVNNVNIFYEVTGKGAPVILLHGNGESHKIFDVLIKRLAATHCCYAVDSRCHGRSGKGILTYENMAADVAAMIDALGLQKPTVIGFSDGGIVGLVLGIRYGAKIGKIIAAGPNATPDGLRPWFLKAIALGYKITRSEKLALMLNEPHISTVDLSGIKNSVVILCGERDIIKTTHAEYIAASIPTAHCEILPGEGHASYVVHSPKFYEIIEKYL